MKDITSGFYDIGIRGRLLGMSIWGLKNKAERADIANSIPPRTQGFARSFAHDRPHSLE